MHLKLKEYMHIYNLYILLLWKKLLYKIREKIFSRELLLYYVYCFVNYYIFYFYNTDIFTCIFLRIKDQHDYYF